MNRLKVGFLVFSLSLMPSICSSVDGGEILVNGTLESSASPTGWALQDFITGEPNLKVNVTEQIGGNASEFDGGLGLFVRPFAGNLGDFAGENHAVSSVLSQTVNVSPGREYTFSGSARWQGDGDPDTNDGFSGGVDFLLPESPSDPDMTGEVPSPTKTYFQMEFLDANDALIGQALRIDLKDDDQTNDDFWLTHSIKGTAPASASKVRVSAAALDMVDNVSAQIAFFDSFSLRDDTNSGVERLQNADLDILGAPLGFEVAEVRNGGDTLIGFRNFANHTEDGQHGLWLRAFAGGDGEILQDADATPGGEYEFSAWSKWEQGYSGGLDDPDVITFLNIQFRDAMDNVLSSETLDLVEADQINDGVWRQYSLKATAPANTDHVRVRAGATGMYNTGINPQSAFFDDFSLIETLVVIDGDYNVDGELNVADLNLQTAAIADPDPDLKAFDHNDDGVVDIKDRTIWVEDFKMTVFGDADLNGAFGTGDLVRVFRAGKFETGQPADWNEGDFDGDGLFGTGDLVAAFQAGGFDPNAAVNPVPETGGGVLALLGALGLFFLARRRSCAPA